MGGNPEKLGIGPMRAYCDQLWLFWIDSQADLLAGYPRRPMAWLTVLSIQHESVSKQRSILKIGNLNSFAVKLDRTGSAGLEEPSHESEVRFVGRDRVHPR